MSVSVFVSVELDGRTVEVGTAYFARRNTTVSTSFRYAEEYLARPGAHAIDPAMPLLKGNYAPAGLPGAFADCSPDRWGQEPDLEGGSSESATRRSDGSVSG